MKKSERLIAAIPTSRGTAETVESLAERQDAIWALAEESLLQLFCGWHRDLGDVKAVELLRAVNILARICDGRRTLRGLPIHCGASG